MFLFARDSLSDLIYVLLFATVFTSKKVDYVVYPEHLDPRWPITILELVQLS